MVKVAYNFAYAYYPLLIVAIKLIICNLHIYFKRTITNESKRIAAVILESYARFPPLIATPCNDSY